MRGLDEGHKDELTHLEKSMLAEMEHYLGVGGITLDDRIAQIATAIGAPIPFGSDRERVRQLWQLFHEAV